MGECKVLDDLLPVSSSVERDPNWNPGCACHYWPSGNTGNSYHPPPSNPPSSHRCMPSDDMYLLSLGTPHTSECDLSLFVWNPQRRYTPPNSREPHFTNNPIESPIRLRHQCAPMLQDLWDWKKPNWYPNPNIDYWLPTDYVPRGKDDSGAPSNLCHWSGLEFMRVLMNK